MWKHYAYVLFLVEINNMYLTGQIFEFLKIELMCKVNSGRTLILLLRLQAYCVLLVCVTDSYELVARILLRSWFRKCPFTPFFIGERGFKGVTPAVHR